MSWIGPALSSYATADSGRGFTLEVRPRTLLLIVGILSVVVAINAFILGARPDTAELEQRAFGLAALTLAMLACAYHLRRVSYLVTVTATLAIIAALIIERVLVLFLSDYFDDPAHEFFMPVFATLPVLYLLSFTLLPEPRATHVALWLWIPISLLVTALTLPYWGEQPVRGSLVTLLSSLWLGHGLYVVLFSVSARRQQGLIARQQAMAESERMSREAVAESEARFRSIFDLAAVGIVVSDETGRFLMVNGRMVDLLGYSREDLLVKRLHDVTLPADLESSLQQFHCLLDRQVEQFRLETRYLRKDGSTVYAEVFVRELDPMPGASRRFVCIAQDISERKRAEQQAAEHRRVRDFHFDNTPLAVVEFAPDMTIKRWSKRAERLFGWTEAEVLGRTTEQVGVLEADQFANRAERVRRILAGEINHVSALIPAVHRNGRRLWVEVYNSATRDAEGRVQTLISMAQDVTESQDMLRMLNESEARFRGIFNQAAVGIALLNGEGRWLNVNQKLCEITGYSLEELLEIDFQTITYPDDLDRDLHMARAVIDGTIDRYSMEKRYVCKNGSIVWVMLYVRRLDATADLPARFVSVVEDINERKAAEERVRQLTQSLESRVAERTAQLRDIIRAGQRRNEELSLISDMSRLLSAATTLADAGQVVVRYLPRIFPLADGALYLSDEAREHFERQAHWGEAKPGSRVFLNTECWALRRGELHHVEGEADALNCQHVSPESREHPHICMPVLALGAPLGLIELAWGRTAEGWAPEIPLVKAVAEKIGLAFGNLRLREELSRQALVDPLTGLNNRRWLENCLKLRAARHARNGEGFAVLMIDVDHFKSINDGYGHEAGDRALQEIAGALARAVRDGEAAARFGGEEFTVVLDTAQVNEARAVGERMREAVTGLRVRYKDSTLPPLTISVGVAMCPRDGHDAQTVIERADSALYIAKRNGRNQVQLAELPDAGSGVEAIEGRRV